MTDLRALITEMADELDHNRQCLMDDRRLTHPLADKARAALAQPEPEVPTDDELNALWNCCGIADEYGHHEGNFFGFARAVLARWGTAQ